MITALDHFVLICPDLEAGADAYSKLLGRSPDWLSVATDGAATALFKLENTALELIAPTGEGAVGDRLRELHSDSGPGLTSLAFASNDIETDHHLAGRRGLAPSDIIAGDSVSAETGAKRVWKRFRCADEACAGVKTFVIQQVSGVVQSSEAEPGSVGGLDHIVIATPNPDRAVAHYGTRLGLDFRFDRTAEEWKTRFLFFRTGGLTFEVIHRLGQDNDPTGSDSIWGLTWLVKDIEGAHSRLSEGGFDVSDVRNGRKKGSRVFTVRDGTLDVPTLFIAHEPR
ncbi:MAG: VOC family protein [Pseudomonadota bacterium]